MGRIWTDAANVFETVVDEYHSVTSQVFRTESTKPIMENIKKLINM